MKTLASLCFLSLLAPVAFADEEIFDATNEAAIAVAAQSETAALVVDTAFVADAIQRGAILWDARVQEEYRKGHIPGAVNIGDPLRVLRSENSEDFTLLDSFSEFHFPENESFLDMFDFLKRKYLRYGCSKVAPAAPK